MGLVCRFSTHSVVMRHEGDTASLRVRDHPCKQHVPGSPLEHCTVDMIIVVHFVCQWVKCLYRNVTLTITALLTTLISFAALMFCFDVALVQKQTRVQGCQQLNHR